MIEAVTAMIEKMIENTAIRTAHLPCLRKLENTGRPLGEEGFVKSVGQQIGRDIAKKKPGPKPKEAN